MYRKPLARGGHRLIPRTGGGQFTRASLDCRICPSCRAINVPEYKDETVNGFRSVTKEYPTTCHSCGGELKG